MSVSISQASPHEPDIAELLEAHLALMRATSPPEDVHALDLDGLAVPDITMVAARHEDGQLLGIGALKRLDAEHSELKSMHTAAAARGLGIGRSIAEFLIELARLNGNTRVSLETGSFPEFEPARRLYERLGFEYCRPFADYPDSPNSVHMTLELSAQL